jgi:hypothetical protein
MNMNKSISVFHTLFITKIKRIAYFPFNLQKQNLVIYYGVYVCLQMVGL